MIRFTIFQHNPPLNQMMSTSTDGDGGSSTSSSGSLGSSEQSSGYGSQNAIVRPFGNGNNDTAATAARSSGANAGARVAVKHLQKSETGKCREDAIFCLPLIMHGQII